MKGAGINGFTRPQDAQEQRKGDKMKIPKLNGKALKKMYYKPPRMTTTLGVLGAVSLVMLAAVVNGIKVDREDAEKARKEAEKAAGK